MSEKKTKRAAVLRYDPERDGAPVLAAYGEGYVAERLLERAEEYGVPTVADEPLAVLLSQLDVGSEIPPELYDLVAKILVFVAEMDKTYAEKYGKRK
jgi:flagellar biosynthesis protein